MTSSTTIVPRVAVSVLVKSFDKTVNAWLYLLVQRKNPPACGMWSLPGGKVKFQEPILTAALRELEEETNIKESDIQKLSDAFLSTDAIYDTSHYVISTATIVVKPEIRNIAKAQDDAAALQWVTKSELQKLQNEGIIAGELVKLIDISDGFSFK